MFKLLSRTPVKEWSLEELAEKTGADAQLLHRLLRCQASVNHVRETKDGNYGSSHITPFLALPGTAATIAFNNLFLAPMYLTQARYLKSTSYNNPTEHEYGIGHVAAGIEAGAPLWDIFASDPEKANAAFGYFEAQRHGQKGAFIDAPLARYQHGEEDLTARRVFLCDVGGGSGHQCLALRHQRPELRGVLAVTDLASMICQQDKQALVVKDIKSEVHDFLSEEPCPIQGAKIYYLRNIMHDWNDQYCIKILKHLRQAMAPDSIILIDEIVMPEICATTTACVLDISMLNHSSWERSDAQWRHVFTEAGFSLDQKYCYDSERLDHLIFGVQVHSR